MSLNVFQRLYVNFQTKRRERRFHRKSNNKAKEALDVVERDNGVQLDQKTIEKCDEYAVEVLGWKGYAEWLYLYSAISGKFSEGWIPNNYYAKKVIPNVNGSFGDLCDKKSITNQLFKSDRFPDILRSIKGRFFDNDFKVVKKKDLSAFLFQDCDKIVFKKDNSAQGLHVYVLDRDSFKNFDIESLNNGVFQRFIKQHDFFDEICSTSVQNLRLTTVSYGDTIEPRAAYFRVGRTKNSHLKANSNLRLAVDLKTGEIDEIAYMPDWSTVEKHPDTGFIFKNKFIPQFAKAKELVIELHKVIPYVGCVGWDVAINKDGKAEIMEWNGGQTDIKFSEALTGPCFTGLGWEKLWKNR